MASRNCASVIQAHTMRVARLDSSGAPLAGADNLAVVNLITMGYTVVVEEGANLTQKNGRGVQCFKYQGDDKITGVNNTLQLCQLDFELISLMTGAVLLTSGADTRGSMLPDETDELSTRVSVELWSLLWDGDEPYSVDGEAQALRTIFPSTSWVEGDRTYGEELTIISLTGRGRGNSGWGNGPANDLPWRSRWSAKAEWTDDVSDIPEATCGTSSLVAS